jgi:hypothetical protein
MKKNKKMSEDIKARFGHEKPFPSLHQAPRRLGDTVSLRKQTNKKKKKEPIRGIKGIRQCFA